MQSFWRKGNKRRGSILLLALFFLFTLFLMAVAFFRLLPTELHSAARSSRDMKAHYACDAGVREAVAWLKTEPSDVPAAEIAAFNSGNSGWSTNNVDGTWSYTVEITSLDPTRGIYEAHSIAHMNGRPVRELRAVVQNQSFAKYALFIDTWGEDQIFEVGSDGIQGPFHTNGYFRLSATGNGTNMWNDGKTPWVTGIRDAAGNLLEPAKMTQASQYDVNDPNNPIDLAPDGIMWNMGNYKGADPAFVPYDNTTGSADADRYNRLVEGGRERISYVQPIKLPEENTELRDKAWDGNTAVPDTSDVPSGSGLYVNTTSGPNVAGSSTSGGIFVRGDADMKLAITTGNGDHQKVSIHQGNETVNGTTETIYHADVTYYKVWIDPAPYTQPTTVCTHTTMVNDQPIRSPLTVDCGYDKTGQSPLCGTEEVWVPGSGGSIGSWVTQNKTCTYHVNQTCPGPIVGWTQKPQCDAWGPGPNQTIDPPGYWDYTATSTTPNAVAYTKNEVVDSTYPGAVGQDVTNKVSVEKWQSVVEVNETNFQIPIGASGVKVNGTLVTDPADPILTVPDGKTVFINHDVTKSGVYYGEFTILDGRTNGIVFSDGNIKALEGVNKGAFYQGNGETAPSYHGRTIAANLSGNKTIEIRDSLLQYYNGSGKDAAGNNLNDGQNRLVPGNISPSAEHILGLIGKDITIHTDTGKNSSYYSGSKEINVYAVMMAGRQQSNGTVNGGFGVHTDNMQQADKMGFFNLYGGLITGNAKSTRTPYAAKGWNSGFNLDLNYDWIASQNLENFPTTQNFSVLRYVETHLDS